MGSAFDRLHLARRQIVELGATLPGTMDAWLARSWQRSQRAGVQPFATGELAEPLAGIRFEEVLHGNAQMLAFARPVVDFMYGQIRGGHCMVVLADAHSVLLHTVGDDSFLSKARRVALRTGVSWDESVRGTNAIGTAIADDAAVQVRADEHYLEQNGFLHCSAAPIYTAQGAIAGAIDISGDACASQAHALGLTCSAARMIENHWIKARYPEHVHIHLHGQPEGIDTPGEGIVVLTEEGTLVGANREAMRLLRLAPPDFFALQLEARLQQRLEHLLRGADGRIGALRLPDGRQQYLRVDRPSVRRVRPATPAAGTPRRTIDALDACDTGDAQWHEASLRVRRILDKPIALLIEGESGVGKEVFARACHDSGPRRGRPFVAVNCAAIPESLIEAELFGYAPGAYTGAGKGGSLGRIREADGGTLFLDEIGDMPLLLQTRLLRVLQERKVTPLGGAPVVVDFALMSATHCDLRAAVAEGRFRSDLYYRIQGYGVRLPALRQRTDFDALVEQLLRQFDTDGVAIAPDLMQALRGHDWPGNLRQLASVLRTACALRDPLEEPCIDWPHLSSDLREEMGARRRLVPVAPPAAPPAPTVSPAPATQGRERVSPAAIPMEMPPQTTAAATAATALRQLTDSAIRQAMEQARGNVSQAARLLSISRQTVYRRLRRDA